MATSRRRLDLLLVDRGLMATRAAARRAIVDGGVVVDGTRVRKPAGRFEADVAITLDREARRVSRGGTKLASALDTFGVRVEGLTALDAGASTGGFTEELLDRGAVRVVAVDVGHGQLDPSLRADPRVEAHDGVNVRGLTPGAFGERFPLVVGDLSFISLTKVADGLVGQLAPAGDMVLLVKPQFEVGAAQIGKDGVVRSPSASRRAIDDVVAVYERRGSTLVAEAPSTITGGDGNHEVFVHLRGPDS